MVIRKAISAKGRQVITTTPETLISEAAGVMGERRIGILVVCGDEGEVVGVLSERDLVRAIAAQPDSVPGLTVEALMTRNPITCEPGDKPRDVLLTMNEKGFRHMPVVESGKLKGLVSVRDVLRYMLENAQDDHVAMRELNELGVY